MVKMDYRNGHDWSRVSVGVDGMDLLKNAWLTKSIYTSGWDLSSVSLRVGRIGQNNSFRANDKKKNCLTSKDIY